MPQPPSTAHFDPRLVLLACLTLLLLGLFARLRRTSHSHLDYAARADMTRLLAVVWGGLLVEWARSRAGELTPGFWLASLALLPFVVGALMLSIRLFRAYRVPLQQSSTPSPTTLPLATPKPSILPIPGAKGGRK